MQSLTIGLFGAALALASSSVLAHAGHQHESEGGDGHACHAPVQRSTTAENASAPEDVTVSDCWIRALPNRLPAAAYFRISNTGEQNVVLRGAEAQGFSKVMLHGHDESGGMARMTHVEAVTVGAGQQFEFAPRGHHVMLEQADFDLEIGSQRPLTLWFEGDKALTVQCEVKAPGTLK